MTHRHRSILPLVAAMAMSFGITACTESEQNAAEADAEVAADRTADVAAEAGDALVDGAAQAGEVIEGGAMKAAQAVEDVSGDAARKLEAEQAEAAAEGRPGAINPATDERQ
ncbi:hypothetical protein [Brevundimonas variabilis]|uniref:50S ribosomal protein L7/L12 domain protein n=1 Tax=Brevundimonas variabilis TaxID=74312 RepID=A0A7W9FF78_9CAUL|nr:hypothetical protein [Brevundimonas variabilis]MBB5745139.1 hypothetical protein [Brevundimonas variabilis]